MKSWTKNVRVTSRVGLLAAGIVACSATSAVVYAAPSISNAGGTMSAGTAVTITGTGFGSKPTAQPVLWDNFEGGTVGKTIKEVPAVIGKWDTGAGSDQVTYTRAKVHSGTMAARNDFTSFYLASLAKNMTFSRLYLDFWMVVDYIDIKSRNWKPWRL